MVFWLRCYYTPKSPGLLGTSSGNDKTIRKADGALWYEPTRLGPKGAKWSLAENACNILISCSNRKEPEGLAIRKTFKWRRTWLELQKVLTEKEEECRASSASFTRPFSTFDVIWLLRVYNYANCAFAWMYHNTAVLLFASSSHNDANTGQCQSGQWPISLVWNSLESFHFLEWSKCWFMHFPEKSETAFSKRSNYMSWWGKG